MRYVLLCLMATGLVACAPTNNPSPAPRQVAIEGKVVKAGQHTLIVQSKDDLLFVDLAGISPATRKNLAALKKGEAITLRGTPAPKDSNLSPDINEVVLQDGRRIGLE